MQQPRFETAEAFAAALQHQFDEEKVKPSLVVVDTYRPFIRVPDLNDYSAVTDRLESIVRLCEHMGASGTSSLLIHHRRKAGGEGSDASLGSQRLAAEFDSIINLSRVQNSDKRRLAIDSRYGDSDLGSDFKVSLDIDTGIYSLADSLEDQRDAVMTVLHEHGTQSRDEVHVKLEAIGMALSEGQVRTRLGELVTAGRAEREGKGKKTTYTAAA